MYYLISKFVTYAYTGLIYFMLIGFILTYLVTFIFHTDWSFALFLVFENYEFCMKFMYTSVH